MVPTPPRVTPVSYTHLDVYKRQAVGYGVQPTGGYSISVNELYLTDNSIVVNTELKGPEKGENAGAEQSFPYIVIRTEYLENPVVFPVSYTHLVYVAEHYLGLKVTQRPVKLSELDEFAECGLCGTAAVISPVGRIEMCIRDRPWTWYRPGFLPEPLRPQQTAGFRGVPANPPDG